MTGQMHAAAVQPYPGLRPFLREETDIFFGRERYVDQMVDRLREHRFLAVTGTSGSGKSSIVRTGLLSALELGLLSDVGGNWSIIDMRPGTRPMATLAGELNNALRVPRTPGDVEVTQAALERGPKSLVEYIQRFGPGFKDTLLILVDQFEEIFRFAKGSSLNEAEAFVNMLLGSAAQREVPIYVVLTMRSDFLGDCARFYDLPEMINKSQFLTPRMSREEYREAIEEPARVCGGLVERAVTARILNDMVDVPDQLCLVQHAMMMMWRRAVERDKNSPRLTLADYVAIGGLTGLEGHQGALSGHAGEVFEKQLPSDQHREIARRMFQRLTEGAGRGSDVRRPSSFKELCAVTGAKPDMLRAIIDTFRAPENSFLMPPVPAPISDDTIIDVSHESLIRQWKQLREWTTSEFESAATYRRLEEHALRWKAGTAGYWTDLDLGQAIGWRDRQQPNAEWAARYGQSYDVALDFLERSRKAASRALYKQRFARAAAIIVGVSLAAFAYLWVASQQNVAELRAQKDEADRWRGEAYKVQFKRILSSAEEQLKNQNWDEGRALALAGRRIVSDWNHKPMDSDEFHNVLAESMAQDQRKLYVELGGPLGDDMAAAFTLDGTRVVWTVSGSQQMLNVSDAVTGKLLKRVPHHGSSRVHDLLISRDANFAAVMTRVTSDFRRIEIIGQYDAQTPWSKSIDEEYFAAAAFAEGERTVLAAVKRSGTVAVYDIDGREIGNVAPFALKPKPEADEKAKKEKDSYFSDDDNIDHAISCFKNRCVTIGSDGRLILLAVSPDVKELANRELEPWKKENDKPTSIALNEDRIYILQNGFFRTFHITETPTGTGFEVGLEPQKNSSRGVQAAGHGHVAVADDIAEKNSASVDLYLFPPRNSDAGGRGIVLERSIAIQKKSLLDVNIKTGAAVVVEGSGDDRFIKLVRPEEGAGRHKCDKYDCDDYQWLGGSPSGLFAARGERSGERTGIDRLDPASGEFKPVIEGIDSLVAPPRAGAVANEGSQTTTEDLEQSASKSKDVKILDLKLTRDKKRVLALVQLPIPPAGTPTEGASGRDEGDSPSAARDADRRNASPELNLQVASIDLETGKLAATASPGKKPEGVSNAADANTRDTTNGLRSLIANVFTGLTPNGDIVMLEGEVKDRPVRVLVTGGTADAELRVLRDPKPESRTVLAVATDGTALWRNGSQPFVLRRQAEGAQSEPAPMEVHGEIASFGLLDQGAAAFVAYSDGRLDLWSLTGPRPALGRSIETRLSIDGLAWTADERVVYVRDSKEIKVFDRASGRFLDRYSDGRSVRYLQELDQGSLFIVSGIDYLVKPLRTPRDPSLLRHTAEAVTLHQFGRNDQLVKKDLILQGIVTAAVPTRKPEVTGECAAKPADAPGPPGEPARQAGMETMLNLAGYEDDCVRLGSDTGLSPVRRAFFTSELSNKLVFDFWSGDGSAPLASDLALAATRDPIGVARLGARLIDESQGPSSCQEERADAARALYAFAVQNGGVIHPSYVALELVCHGLGSGKSLAPLKPRLLEQASAGDPLAQALLGYLAEFAAQTPDERAQALVHYTTASALFLAEREQRPEDTREIDRNKIALIEKAISLRRIVLARSLEPAVAAKSQMAAETASAALRQPSGAAPDSAPSSPSWQTYQPSRTLAALISPDLGASIEQGRLALQQLTGGKAAREIARLSARATYGLLRRTRDDTAVPQASSDSAARAHLAQFIRQASAASEQRDPMFKAIAKLSEQAIAGGPGGELPFEDLKNLADLAAARADIGQSNLTNELRGDLYFNLAGQAAAAGDKDAAASLAIGAVDIYEDLDFSLVAVTRLTAAMKRVSEYLPSSEALRKHDAEFAGLRWNYPNKLDDYRKNPGPVRSEDAERMVIAGLELQERYLDTAGNDAKRVRRLSYAHTLAGIFFHNQNRVDAALPHYERALQVDQQVLEQLGPSASESELGQAWRNLAVDNNNIANISSRLGKVDRYSQYSRKSLEAWKQAMAFHHSEATQEKIFQVEINAAINQRDTAPARALVDVFNAYRALTATEATEFGKKALTSKDVFIAYALSILSKQAAPDGHEAAATDCDLEAGIPEDPLLKIKGTIFNDLKPDHAIESCENAIRQLGRKPGLVFNLTRAKYKKNEKEKYETLRGYEEAAKAGYPVAFNNVGNLVTQIGLPAAEGNAQADAAYLEFFNRVVHCCGARAVEALLASKDGLDPGNVKYTAGLILDWAAVLGSPSALENRAELTLSGFFDPHPASDAAMSAYSDLKLAERQYQSRFSDRVYERHDDEAGEVRTRSAAAKLATSLDPPKLAEAAQRIGGWKPKPFDSVPPWMVPVEKEPR